ncbi:hypothetical protein [Sphingomonas sp.]|uniref:hypothetical protein n=1 Tax=Sphingomonas sp. TaxID=28214 RepID=UPI0035C7C7CF
MHDHPQPSAGAAAPHAAALPATQGSSPERDAHGFDPGDFEWRPVPRRPRADGWSPEVQARFVEALADTGLVSAACAAVDMSVASAYRLRRAAGAESFARAWDAALDAAADHLQSVAFACAIEGVGVPVYDRDGCRIGSKRQYNDRLLMLLLRAYRPDRFRHAHEDTRRADEPRPAPTLSMARATPALSPVAPAEPHRLMAPDALADALDAAAGLGELYELYPDLERERYVRPVTEPDSHVATERARARAAREAARDDADWARGNDPFAHAAARDYDGTPDL